MCTLYMYSVCERFGQRPNYSSATAVDVAACKCFADGLRTLSSPTFPSSLHSHLFLLIPRIIYSSLSLFLLYSLLFSFLFLTIPWGWLIPHRQDTMVSLSSFICLSPSSYSECIRITSRESININECFACTDEVE